MMTQVTINDDPSYVAQFFAGDVSYSVRDPLDVDEILGLTLIKLFFSGYLNQDPNEWASLSAWASRSATSTRVAMRCI